MPAHPSCLARPVRHSLAAAALLIPTAGAAASERLEIRGAQAGARVTPFVLDVDLRRLPPAPSGRPGDLIRDFPQRSHDRSALPPPRPSVPDPLFPLQTDRTSVADLAFPVPSVSFDGQGFSSATVPDPVGDVGPDHYIQAVNSNLNLGGASVVVYDKAGQVLAGPVMIADLVPGVACRGGDPVVLYDALADRWVVSEMSWANLLCVYVSRTGDPVTGGWFAYAFSFPDVPDYPKYGVWPDAYYVGANDVAALAYALDRGRMIQGLPAGYQRFTAPPLAGYSFNALLPADLDGNLPPPAGAPGLFVRHRDDEAHQPPGTPGQDFLELWEFHVDWSAPSSSTFTRTDVAVAEFDSDLCGLGHDARCVPQPGGGALPTLSPVAMWRLQYRNFGTRETLVGNFTVDADGNDHHGPRWFELRKAPTRWLLHQEGTHAPDALHRWMGSAAMDGAGNIAVGYSVSSAVTFPGLRYAGRLAGETPGTLPQGEGVLADGLSTHVGVRWGDYAALSVDPADDCTFWFTGEYSPAAPGGATAQWATRIGAFGFDACASQAGRLAVGDAAVVEGQSGTRDAVFTVALSGHTQVETTVRYAVAGCTAAAGSDYAAVGPGVLSFPAQPQGGISVARIAVPVLGDGSGEPDEAFVLILSEASGATIADGWGQGLIVSDDNPLVVPPRIDFNGDGESDLLWQRADTARLQAWLMDGTQETDARYVSPDVASAGWLVVGSADFDADGKADILWRNVDSGQLSVWFMNGVLRREGQLVNRVLGSEWTFGGTGDFNQDGRPDILWRHQTTGALQAWLMNGALVSQEAGTNPPSLPDLNWQLSGIADLNRDGKVDLLWRHSLSNVLVAWLMDGLVRQGGQQVASSGLPNQAWSVAALWDADRSGTTDIVWRNQSSGRLVAWMMNDLSQVCAAELSPGFIEDARWQVVGPR